MGRDLPAAGAVPAGAAAAGAAPAMLSATDNVSAMMQTTVVRSERTGIAIPLDERNMEPLDRMAAIIVKIRGMLPEPGGVGGVNADLFGADFAL